MVYIYGLHTDKDETIRYVGKTKNTRKRLTEHLCQSRYNNYKSTKEQWILSEIQKCNMIKLSIIEECNNDNWKVREIYWISKLPHLTNASKGGEMGGRNDKYNISYGDAKIIVHNGK